MVFSNAEYLFFFLIVFTSYWLLPSNKTRKIFLLVSSYAFYAAWNPKFCFLMFLSTTVDYVIGCKVATSQQKKLLLRISVATNLGILGFFKYHDFFIESFVKLLSVLGIDIHVATLHIILPVGISFYTFQSMSYTLDIYRGKISPTGSFLDFALYVSFFPQLVAGPIVRAAFFLRQLNKKREFREENIFYGFKLFFIGYIKKVYFADYIGLNFVDPVFNDISQHSASALVLASIGFGIQIYGDFSGYSDMARGSARLLGYNLPINFNFPYHATSISEFWRRWHISLSTFLRDYLYIFALGGSKFGRTRTLVNLFITMFLGGLWHGASWNFVLWGGFHGILLVVEHQIKNLEFPYFNFFSILGRWLFTFILVHVGWILFRVTDIVEIFEVFEKVFTWSDGDIYFTNHLLFLYVISFVILIIRIKPAYRIWSLLFIRTPLTVKAILFFIIITFVLLISGEKSPPFIYFQF